ncbi:MAG: hypothetical protein V2I51_16040 [Anderseniella sp.]|jgi:hypothetical protein|nr:hypothetical protein [Anderseniella sp.]
MSKESKAERKARQKQLRAMGWTLLGMAVIGEADSAELTAAALELVAIAASGEIDPEKARAIAEVCDDIGGRMMEIAERGDAGRQD